MDTQEVSQIIHFAMVDDDDAGWHKRRDKRMDDSDRGKMYQARRHSTLVAVHQLATTRLVASSSRWSNDDEMAGVLHGQSSVRMQCSRPQRFGNMYDIGCNLIVTE